MENQVSFCPNCGFKIAGPISHCPNCGSAQPGQAPQPIPAVQPAPVMAQPAPVAQPAPNQFVNKVNNIASASLAQAKQAKADAKEVYETLTTKEGFMSTMKKAGTFGMVLMGMAATAALVFLVAFLLMIPPVVLVALIPAAAAFYVVRKVKGSFAWIGALVLWIFSGLGLLGVVANAHWNDDVSVVLAFVTIGISFALLIIELKIGPMKKVHVLRYVGMWMGFLGLGVQIGLAIVAVSIRITRGIGIYELIMAVLSLGAYVMYIIMICKLKPKSWLFATIASGCFLVSAFSLLHPIALPFWAAFITLELIARSKTKAQLAAAAQAQLAAQQYQQYQQMPPQQPMM